MTRLQLLLCLVLFCITLTMGCQSSKQYWYHSNKTFEETKWDLITSAQYTAYGCPTYCKTTTEDGIRTISVLERNMLDKGYQRLKKTELPENASKDTVWMYLVPHYIAGFKYDLPRWPQLRTTSQSSSKTESQENN